MKLARISGPRGEVLRIVEIPGNDID